MFPRESFLRREIDKSNENFPSICLLSETRQPTGTSPVSESNRNAEQLVLFLLFDYIPIFSFMCNL